MIFLPNGAIAKSQYDKSSLKSKLKLLDQMYSRLYNIIPNPDNRIRSEGMAVYDKTIDDPVVGGSIDTIMESVKSLEYKIEPNGANAKEIDIIKEFLINLIDDNIFGKIVNAMFYGNQYIDVVWDDSTGYLSPIIAESRPHEHFVYKLNEDQTNFELHYYPEGSFLNSIPIPNYKILVPTFKDTSKNPYGKGLLSSCYKSAFIKNNAWDLWAIFVEDHGMPKIDASISMGLANTLKSQFQLDDTQLVNMIQEQLQTLRQDGVFTHYEGISVNPLSTGKSDDGVTHKDLMDYCDKQIAILLLGHNGSSQSTPGKLGSEDMAYTVLDSRIRSYGNFVAANLNKLIAWFHELNFNVGKAPKIELYQKDGLSKYKQRAEVDQILTTMGLQLTADYFSENYNIDKKYIVGFSQASTTSEPPAPPPKKADVKKNHSCSCDHKFENASKMEESEDILDALDGLSEHIINLDEYQSIHDDTLAKIIKFVNSCDNYEDMQEGIIDLYPTLDYKKLRNILTNMMLISSVLGESIVNTEVEDGKTKDNK